MRLIDADTAIDELKKCRKIYCDNTPESFSLLSHSDKSRVDEIDNAIATLVNLPSVQPEQRQYGEWIPFEWSDNYSRKIPLPKGSDSHMEEYWAEEFICSVCGREHHARDFCPYCGADMRGEKNK